MSILRINIHYIYIYTLFSGDHPEIQYLSGNLHGGNYPCICGSKKSRFTDVPHFFCAQIISLEERRRKVN